MKYESGIRNQELRSATLGVILFALLSLFVPYQTHAAEIYFGAHEKVVNVGDTFEVGVFLNTAGEAVNAVGSQIVVTNNILTIQDIRRGNSLVNLWVDEPVIKDNTVSFSGVIPGGYNGTDAYLFSIILEAKKEGSAIIKTTNDQLLLNDGVGNSVRKHTQAPLTLTIKNLGVTKAYIPQSDDVAPEVFAPQIGSDPALFGGKSFVAFVTQDKQSGVSRYGVFESQSKFDESSLARRTDIPWQETGSPYLLVDQALHSYVYVQAIDRAGNVRVVRLAPIHPLPWYENSVIWSILIIGTLLVSGAILWFRFRKKKAKV